jgi:putative hydrolase
MEISSAHRETDEVYVRAAAREGVEFVLSSDAHRPSRVGDLEAALRVARRAGLSPERVYNVARSDPQVGAGKDPHSGQRS